MKRLHAELLIWYGKNKRDLPWRRSKEPYRVWLSEIMLQQTRVEAVLPYYERFLATFPSVRDLAAAPEDKVTNLWAGLGYYSRARNLRKSAQLIVLEFEGKFPRTPEDLHSLPGIGEYTCNAIASICFDANVAAVDGNLERVIARLIALEKNPKTAGKQEIRDFATRLVAPGRAGEINQALMDLASSTCLPKKPRCEVCPLTKNCLARKRRLTASIPKRPEKKDKVLLQARGVIYLSRGRLLVAKRPQGEWLSGMWDIPWWVGESEWKLPGNSFGNHEVSRTITHHRIQFKVAFVQAGKVTENILNQKLRGVASEWKWIPLGDLDMVNLPRPTEKALNEALRSCALA